MICNTSDLHQAPVIYYCNVPSKIYIVLYFVVSNKHILLLPWMNSIRSSTSNIIQNNCCLLFAVAWFLPLLRCRGKLFFKQIRSINFFFMWIVYNSDKNKLKLFDYVVIWVDDGLHICVTRLVLDTRLLHQIFLNPQKFISFVSHSDRRDVVIQSRRRRQLSGRRPSHLRRVDCPRHTSFMIVICFAGLRYISLKIIFFFSLQFYVNKIYLVLLYHWLRTC